jgi:hypothetical protein
VRLTDADKRANDARRAQTEQCRAADAMAAYRAWRAGQLMPAAITTALDAAGLHGPEVDEACGAVEPDVDRWEAGTLYPSWEQLRALAALTGKTPRFFAGPYQPLSVWDTTLRFHMSHTERLTFANEKPPVLAFTRDAIDTRLKGDAP